MAARVQSIPICQRQTHPHHAIPRTSPVQDLLFIVSEASLFLRFLGGAMPAKQKGMGYTRQARSSVSESSVDGEGGAWCNTCLSDAPPLSRPPVDALYTSVRPCELEVLSCVAQEVKLSQGTCFH